MTIEESILREITANYANGLFDSEAIRILGQYLAGFKAHEFEIWVEREPDLARRVTAGRILARAYWDKAIRDGVVLVPDWYYSAPLPEVRDMLALACQAAERCPIGSAEREREFRNVERLLAVLKR